MPNKIGWREITRHDIELIRRDINKHERILKEIRRKLRFLEKLSEDSEEIEKIKEVRKQKVKGKKGKVKG